MQWKTLAQLVLVLILCVIAAGLYATTTGKHMLVTPGQQSVIDFESCVAAGNAVMESYPRQCRSADGRVFVEQVSVATSTTPSTNATSSTAIVGSGCQIGGCSNELCVDAGSGNTISSCIYRDVYACYRSATCERQTNGTCGWTQTPELQRCIADNSGSAQPVTPDTVPSDVNTY